MPKRIESSDLATDLEAVSAHHRLSSLDPERQGALPERLERRSRPIPFRRYLGAPRRRLPPASDSPEISGPEHGVARLLEDSLGLGGWKRVDNAGFGLRRVPSAGNLHPLEAYVLSDELDDGDRAAVHHYSPFDHALERRRSLSGKLWQSLRAACPEASCFFALSAIYWRCAWKYGERSFRLCHLDTGHAVAALDAAAAVANQRIRWIDVADEDLALLLGLQGNGPESEDAVCLLALGPRGSAEGPLRWRPDPQQLELLSSTPLDGEPSPISKNHRPWPGIPRTAGLTRRRRDAADGASPPSAVEGLSAGEKLGSREVLHRRRSRSTFEDRAIEFSVFQGMIRCVCRAGSSFPWRGDLAVMLFVHRIDGLEPGLYAVLNSGSRELQADLKTALRPDFQWQEMSGGEARLFRLSVGDARGAASHLAGGQSAAGDGAFTVLILARFKEALEQGGPFAYRRIHWQAGQLGHRIYLDGEARGLGVTGLGGFYDDRLCALLGLQDEAWRPVYMLAVGRRSGEDPELEPAYAHRELGAEPVPAFDGGYRISDPPPSS